MIPVRVQANRTELLLHAAAWSHSLGPQARVPAPDGAERQRVYELATAFLLSATPDEAKAAEAKLPGWKKSWDAIPDEGATPAVWAATMATATLHALDRALKTYAEMDENRELYRSLWWDYRAVQAWNAALVKYERSLGVDRTAQGDRVGDALAVTL